MKILLALLICALAPSAFGQTPQTCRNTLLDPHFRVPTQISVGQGPAFGPRSVVPLFSENGMDFYGLDRVRSQTGEPISENGAWIVGVFEDEGLRETESQLLMRRLRNPHLSADYASGLKYVVVDMELADNPDSDKAWLRCIQTTRPLSKCPDPPQVPTVWDVAYFQPQQCILTTEARVLLLDDSLPGIAYTYRQYKAPPDLTFQPSLLKAANIMLRGFETEDDKKDSAPGQKSAPRKRQ